MALVTIGGKRISVTYMPVTRRNEHALREFYARSQKFLEDAGVTEWQERVAKAVAKAPDLLNYIRPDGGYNESELTRQAERIIAYDNHINKDAEGHLPMSMDVALKQAAIKLVDEYQEYLASVPDIARILYFNPDEWPVNAKALDVGIEILMGTIDVSKLPDDLRNKWPDVVPSSDIWFDTEASEVAEYVNHFRSAFGSGAVQAVADRHVGSVADRASGSVGIQSDGLPLRDVDTQELHIFTAVGGEGVGRSAGTGDALAYVSSGDTIDAT